MQFLLRKTLNSSVKRRMCLTTVIGISKCHSNWVPVIFYQYKITDHLRSAYSLPIPYLLCKSLNLSVKRRMCLATVIGYSKCHENWVPVISYQYKITDHLRSANSFTIIYGHLVHLRCSSSFVKR